MKALLDSYLDLCKKTSDDGEEIGTSTTTPTVIYSLILAPFLAGFGPPTLSRMNTLRRVNTSGKSTSETRKERNPTALHISEASYSIHGFVMYLPSPANGPANRHSVALWVRSSPKSIARRTSLRTSSKSMIRPLPLRIIWAWRVTSGGRRPVRGVWIPPPPGLSAEP